MTVITLTYFLLRTQVPASGLQEPHFATSYFPPPLDALLSGLVSSASCSSLWQLLYLGNPDNPPPPNASLLPCPCFPSPQMEFSRLGSLCHVLLSCIFLETLSQSLKIGAQSTGGKADAQAWNLLSLAPGRTQTSPCQQLCAAV